MRGDGVLPQALAKMMRHALGEAARVDKNKRGPVLRGECGEPIVDLVPHFVGRDGAKLASWNFDGQIEFTAMTDLRDDGIGPSGAAEEMGDEFDWLLRGGETNARERFAN